MPLVGPYTLPGTSVVFPAAYATCNMLPISFRNYTAAIVYDVYPSAEACYAGAEPLKTIILPIDREPTAELRGQPVQLTPYVPPVYGDPDPQTGAPTVVTPAVDPTFAPGPLERSALPGLLQFVGANAAIFAGLRIACDDLAAQQPEFSGWAIVPSPFESQPES
jgi:hypothetical protein